MRHFFVKKLQRTEKVRDGEALRQHARRVRYPISRAQLTVTRDFITGLLL
jgi:hypothetical protein